MGENNFCDLDINRFIRIVAGNNDIFEAIRLIRICGRSEEILDENPAALRQFCLIYRNDLIQLEYEQLVEIFRSAGKYLAPLYNDPAFWIENLELIVRDRLEIVIMKGRIIYLKYILESNIYPLEELETALITAVEKLDDLAVNLLLEDGKVDPNMRNGSAMKLIVSYESSKLLTLFVNDERTDVNLGDPLYIACMADNSDLVKILLKSPGITVSPDHVQAAVNRGNDGIIIALVRYDMSNIQFVHPHNRGGILQWIKDHPIP